MSTYENRVTLHVLPACRSKTLAHHFLHAGETATVPLSADMNEAFVNLTVGQYAFSVPESSTAVCEELLSTPLSADVECWAPLLGGTSWLPITRFALWRVLPAGSDRPSPEGALCARVLFEDETSVAELFHKAHRYTFDIESKSFIRAADPVCNAVKAPLRNTLAQISGGTDDRIADYGRLVLFLLSKVSLTEEERAMLAPILAYAPQASELSGVIAREKSVQKLVAETKKDPLGFIDWNGDWNNPWWNAASDANREGTEGETA